VSRSAQARVRRRLFDPERILHPNASGARSRFQPLSKHTYFEARSPADIDKAFSEITGARADALTVLVSGMLLGERSRLVGLAARNRLPAIYTFREFADAGA
jgi:hypothetical protein